MGLVKTRRLAAMRKQQRAKAGMTPPAYKVLSFKSRMIPQEDVEGIVATIVRLDGAIPAAVRKAHVANLRRRHEK